MDTGLFSFISPILDGWLNDQVWGQLEVTADVRFKKSEGI